MHRHTCARTCTSAWENFAFCKKPAAVAIGYQGEAASLPNGLRARETPSQRQALADMAFKGRFSGEIKAPV